MAVDSLLPVYSSSKGAAAVVVALLVQREQIDLDRGRRLVLARVRAGRQARGHGAPAPVTSGGATCRKAAAPRGSGRTWRRRSTPPARA